MRQCLGTFLPGLFGHLLIAISYFLARQLRPYLSCACAIAVAVSPCRSAAETTSICNSLFAGYFTISGNLAAVVAHCRKGLHVRWACNFFGVVPKVPGSGVVVTYSKQLRHVG